MNVARDGFGKAPSVKSCSEGVWRESIDKSGVDHETFVILDDREHKKGDLYSFLTATVPGDGRPGFPIVFVLDHNGRVLLEDFRDPGLEVLKDTVKAQAKVYDKALKEAQGSKDSGDSSDKKEEEEEESE